MMSISSKLCWKFLSLYTAVIFSEVSSQKNYRVTTILDAPFLMRDDGGFSGYIPDVLASAGRIMNVTFTIEHVKDNRYGSLRNDGTANWTGMIGELVRNESDIAAAGLTITAMRAMAVHFSQPYLAVGLRILLKKPAKWQDMEAFMVILSPLRPEVWVIGLVLFFAIAVLLTLIGRFSPWEQLWIQGDVFDVNSPGMTFPNSLLFSFGSLMWQGLRMSPKSVSGRTLACFWWLFAMFFLTVYCANLTAFFLTKEPLTQSVPFSTFAELSSQTNIKYGCIRAGATLSYFKTSKLAVDQRIYQAMMSDKTVLMSSTAEAISKVKHENYAFIGENTVLEYTAARDCDLMVLGETRADKEYGFACRKETTICRDLDVAILKMKEGHILADLKNKWFSGPCMSKAEHEAMWNGVPYVDSAKQAIGSLIDEKAVTLKRFGAPLILLLIGALLSLAILGAEILWVKRYGEPQIPTKSEDERRIRDAMDMSP